MNLTQIIFTLLKNLAFQLPILIILASIIIIVLNKCASGRRRNTALVALIIFLLNIFLNVGISILPLIFSSYDSLRLFSIMSGLWLILNILQAISFGLLGWVLIKALPKKQAI